jgi:amino acid transporter, AAT family
LFPRGPTLLALQIVMFAYLGVELVGMTAGEAKNPEKALTRAINSVALRIAVLTSARSSHALD